MEPLSRLILYFALYSFVGWAVETLYCSYLAGKFVNRGFVNGPLCPIYAVGSFTVLFVMQWLPRNVFLIFLAGLILTSVLEYITSFLLEFFFKARWWDYSADRFNIHGRVCLKNSLCFGVLCVVLVFIVHPFVVTCVGLAPSKVRFVLAAAFTAVFLTDLGITVSTVLNLNRRLKTIHAGMLAIKEKLDTSQWYTSSGIRERIQKLTEAGDHENPVFKSIEMINERIRSLEFDRKLLQERLLHAFPNLRSIPYPEYLNNIRAQISSRKQKKTK